MALSVIVPILNEERAIVTTLGAIRRGAADAEVIVVDGGSSDRSVEAARPLADRVIDGPRGRARQMNAGAAIAIGDAFAFVHADSIVPPDFASAIKDALTDPKVVGGRFDVRLDDPRLPYRLIGALISLRSRISRTGTGDQAIFVRREVFEQLGGFPNIELCEDLDFARKLKRAGRVACLRSLVTTSARRWHNEGLIRTILRMWTIRLLYLSGVSPARLKRMYSDTR
ncbi:MAG TPA: TIGR04283 family arsenosugar biosynthesis glycosyltransferase [Candidatus Binataceae bacterium]|nr:TIGR04283 family arsenosugar biosynthesis glycosyltransferase [Candidatus Binataceae bacterium]